MQKIFSMVFLLSFLIVSACDRKKEEVEPVIRSVKTQVITESLDYEFREFAGQLKPGDQIDLTFELSGSLEEVQLEVGQNVKKGEVLAQIDPVTYELQAQSAKATVVGAEAALVQAQSEYERQEQLAKQKLASQSVLGSAQASLDNAKASLEVAQKQLEIAEENLSKTKITAPYDGVISQVNQKSYAQINVGEAVATMYREGKLEVEFIVPSSIAHKLTVNQEVDIWVSGKPKKLYKGRISELGRLANQVAAFPVVVQITEGIDDLRAGEAVRVRLKVPLAQDETIIGYAVPVQAIITDERQDVQEREAHVFLFDEATSTVKKTLIHIIAVNDNMVITDKGLKPGDIVVTAGANFLYEGTKVKLLSAPDTAKAGE